MKLETLRYAADGPVATLTLNRPERNNAISLRMRDEFDRVMDELDASDDVHAVIVTGAGVNFCAGYDLSSGEMERLIPRDTPGWYRRSFHVSRERWLRLWRLRQVTIGAVHGHCLAGGTDLLGVLDIVFAADDARIGHPQNRVMGMAHTLGLYPLLLGMRRSKEWLLTGDSMTGAEAAELGLVNRAVERAELTDVAAAYAHRVAQVPLDVLSSHKDAVNRWFESMGMAGAMAAAADLDAIDLAGEGMARFTSIATTQGLKAALNWRDGPFSRHRTYWEAYLESSTSPPDES